MVRHPAGRRSRRQSPARWRMAIAEGPENPPPRGMLMA